MRLIFITFAIFLNISMSQAAELTIKGAFSGIAKVVDGDGVKIADIEVRLQGIAAPEKKQGPNEIGKKSTQNLKNLVEGKFIICHLDGKKAGRSGRPSGVCFFNLMDIGAYQIQTGHARDCARYSGGRYAKSEQEAQANGMDLSAEYQLPKYCQEKK